MAGGSASTPLCRVVVESSTIKPGPEFVQFSFFHCFSVGVPLTTPPTCQRFYPAPSFPFSQCHVSRQRRTFFAISELAPDTLLRPRLDLRFLSQVVVALPSPQEKRPPQILTSVGAVAPSMPPLLYSKGNTDESATEGPKQPHDMQQEQKQVNPDEARPLMELSYDKLVYAVGTQTGTFGVPGVREHCYMLKVRFAGVVPSLVRH